MENSRRHNQPKRKPTRKKKRKPPLEYRWPPE